MPPRNPTYSLLIANWNGEAYIERCLGSVLAAVRRAGVEMEVVVVDDASADRSPDLIATGFPKVRLIRLERNVGFGAAVGRGMAELDADWVFLLNNDLALRVDFCERLIRTLRECELSPTDVVFEVSEQESIANFEAFKEIRDYYRDLGFQFALDDTGAGYAGLEALVEISPDYIKVDRAFVSGVDVDPVRKTMLAALQTVAEKTGGQLIAEGLDTLEELETLSELNIPFGQGWLFGKPTPLRAQQR